MMVLGDISGIQNYVFDVAEVGGGQAQRCRARSFLVQLLAETAALRVLRALKWPLDSIRLSGAGKFLIQGPSSLEVENSLIREQHDINEWLLRETRAELRLTLGWDDSESGTESYSQAQQQLQKSKTRPWAPEAGWGLLTTPPWTVGHTMQFVWPRSAQEEETDRDTGQVRRVCRTCDSSRRLGQRLPRAKWLIVCDTPQSADFELLGLGIAVMNEGIFSIDSQVLAVANLQEADAQVLPGVSRNDSSSAGSWPMCRLTNRGLRSGSQNSPAKLKVTGCSGC